MNDGILLRIENRLRELNISQSEVARLANIERSFLKNLRSSIRSGSPYGISVLTLKKLAPALKTTAAWLTEGDDRHTASGITRDLSQDRTAIVRPVGRIDSTSWAPIPDRDAGDADDDGYPVLGHFTSKSQIHFRVNCEVRENFAKRSDVLLCDAAEAAVNGAAPGDFAIVDRVSADRVDRERALCELRDGLSGMEFWSLAAEPCQIGLSGSDNIIYAKVVGVISRLGAADVG